MSAKAPVMAEAADSKNGMTLDELARFVQQAMRTGVPGDAIARINVTWRSSIKKIRVGGPK